MLLYNGSVPMILKCVLNCTSGRRSSINYSSRTNGTILSPLDCRLNSANNCARQRTTHTYLKDDFLKVRTESGWTEM